MREWITENRGGVASETPPDVGFPPPGARAAGNSAAIATAAGVTSDDGLSVPSDRLSARPDGEGAFLSTRDAWPVPAAEGRIRWADSWAEHIPASPPEEVFGTDSRLVPPPQWEQSSGAETTHIIDDPVFKTLVLLIFVGYYCMIRFYRDSLATLFKSLRSKRYGDKLIEEQNYTFSHFLRLTLLTGWLAIGVFAVRCLAETAGPEWTESLPDWAARLLPLAALPALGLVYLYQQLILRAAAPVVRSPLFFEHLRSLRYVVGGVGTVFVTPIILLFALNPGTSAKSLFWLIICLFFIGFFFLLTKTYRYFVTRKVSIFYWFLYLCAVEIFPWSLLLILIGRNIGAGS